MEILLAVLSGFALALVGPWVVRWTGDATGWVMAILPAGLTLYFASYTTAVTNGATYEPAFPWVPGLNVELAFYLDGLSLFFALLISGIGTLIFIYAGGYLKGHHHLGRFFSYLSMFMASMLGLVLANNLVTFYIFFELTSFASFMLIAFNHNNKGSQRAAWQALLVTKAGGLAMLAGFILIEQVLGTLTITEIIAQGDTLKQSHLYLPILLLVLAGAFTKSAQFPFYFWLPNAMQAPTPVSAYLHSATMVKAGIYVLARFSPALGGTVEWMWIVTGIGAVTMLISAWLALQYTDMKGILAYTTIMALGLLTMMLGIGSETAVKACVLFILVHAFYKAALFMVAGAIDHEAHERDVTRISGLRETMPITGGAALAAALSMAGIPLFFGFVGKEVVYEAVLQVGAGMALMGTIAVLSNMALVACAGLLVVKPFLGTPNAVAKKAHAAPLSLWLGPAVLGILSLALGVAPWLIEGSFVSVPASAVLGETVDFHLALWHGINIELILSVITVAGGVALFFLWNRLRASAPMRSFEAVLGTGLDNSYDHVIDGMLAYGRWQTGLLQNGVLRYYLATILTFTAALIGFTLWREQLIEISGLQFGGIEIYEWTLCGLIVAASVAATLFRSRLAAVAAIGVGGFAIALLYLNFGAPDLAMTQFLVETLTVILFVLVLIELPRFRETIEVRTHVRDATIALLTGGAVTMMMLAILKLPFENPMGDYYAEHTYTEAEGQNIVNTILVDFRALDTLGEITVLLIAAFGIFALIKLTGPSEKSTRSTDISPARAKSQHSAQDVS